MNKEPKVNLVAGGAGFLGSHLCSQLLKQKEKVICLDNFATGTPQNVGYLLNKKNNNLQFIPTDITQELPKTKKIDCIYNLASPASPKDYQALELETLKAGAYGSWNLLDLAREHGASFLQASTSEVYGDPMINPQPESYWGNVNPIGARSVYDEAKRYGEALVMAYNRKYNLDTKIVRIFNTYGTRMKANDGRAIPTFLSQALQGKPITIYGDGSQTRSFCYVSDLISGIIAIMGCSYHSPINLGNPKEHSLQELAETILRVTGSNSEIVYKDLPADDPQVRNPDITLAKKLLNWEPRIDLETGLKMILTSSNHQDLIA